MARLAALLLAAILLSAVPATAQLLLVNSNYRVVTIDKPNDRFSVALPGDDPNVPQNWVYLEMKTVCMMPGNRQIDPVTALNHLRPGMTVKVNGGRRWDGGITAETLWFTK